MNNNLLKYLFPTGSIILIISSVLIINHILFSGYLYSLGSLLLIIYHGILAYKADDADRNTKRLYRIGLIASLFLAIGAYFIFTESNSWIVMVLIYAVITLYTSFRIK